jgi:hypothetical protein
VSLARARIALCAHSKYENALVAISEPRAGVEKLFGAQSVLQKFSAQTRGVRLLRFISLIQFSLVSLMQFYTLYNTKGELKNANAKICSAILFNES